MDPALATGSNAGYGTPVVFQDGLGERRRAPDPSGAETLERLHLREELTAIPSFEFALRERASRLSAFRHAYYSRVRCVDRLGAPPPALALVSEAVRGVRLSTLLEKEDRPAIDIHTALHLIRQLVSAVAVLHENARDMAHGAIGPERIVLTPNARIVVVEYVLGSALEQLRYSPEQYWKDLRVALPPSGGTPRFDQRVDVAQIGITALSLVLGRLVADDEYPAGIQDVLSAAWAISTKGELTPLPTGFRHWLSRTLDEQPQKRFASALEARAELDKALASEGDYSAAGLANKVAEAKATLKGQPAAPAAPPEPPRPTEVPEALSHFEPETVRLVQPAQSAQPVYQTPVYQTPIYQAPVYQTPVYHAPEEKREATSSGSGQHQAFDPRAVPHYAPRGSSSDEFEETPSSGGGWKKWLAVAAVLVLVTVAGGAVAAYKFAAKPGQQTGTINISTDPVGAQVVVDGAPRGLTPLTLTLDAGTHSVELRGAGQPRILPITMTAGAQLTQYVELPKAVAAVGQLQVRSDPAGAQVSVDGTPRGASPVLIDALVPGEHDVVLTSELATVKQTVTIEAGATAQLLVPLKTTEGAPVSGWVTVSAPVDLQMYENKKLLGDSRSDRIMVSAGKHEIELLNEVLGYRVTRTVQVPAGKVASIALSWPTGIASINALPWAEVFVDGSKIGETPLGNVSMPIGPHEITFRHPELGEQKQGVTITLKSPARISADLRKKP
ncbi:MAG TPA: PEGA domain-containing protein [Vicinamibacterales bacterium]|nr:PEGA domain-containing protein [Vicinamibacterales bacterium]